MTTHITGRSTCGFCRKQVYLIHLAEQNATVLKIPSSTYMLPEPPVGRSFPENISKLSPDFVTIYQQAAKAESLDLDQIAGPGYRKALEFLVKDYLISIETGDQSKKDEIASRSLHRCITSIGNEKVQAAANAAKLVGNDESHYVKGEVHDIEDLKRFISITLHWLEIELETQELIGGSSTP